MLAKPYVFQSGSWSVALLHWYAKEENLSFIWLHTVITYIGQLQTTDPLPESQSGEEEQAVSQAGAKWDLNLWNAAFFL